MLGARSTVAGATAGLLLARPTVRLLAALSKTTNLAVGCYCADEATCHRSLLRGLLLDAGAVVVDGKRPKEARP